jgi:hypothetical protein
MRHPSDGTLRRIVDEPAAVADADREHVKTCAACLSGLAAAAADAGSVGAALGNDVGPQAPADVDAAWHRLSPALAVERRVVAAPRVPARRWRAALHSPIVAGVGVVALLAGGGAAAAGDWLQIFRSEQIAPVWVTPADLVRLPDLSAYGDVVVTAQPLVHRADDASAAEKETGLAAPQVGELPQGVAGDPAFRVGTRVSAVFTYSAEKAAQTAAESGETLPPAPPGLDGARFRLVAGPGLAIVWSDARGIPALVVARAVAPTVYSTGISFDVAADYLLALPGLPVNLASQLRGLSGDGTTLPLPLPAGVETGSADVAGAPATVFRSSDGTVAGVVWVDDGLVTVVAGTVTDDEAVSVARGLR